VIIEDQIYDFLTAALDVTVYPGWFPQTKEPPFPCVSFTVIGADHLEHFSGSGGKVMARVQIDSWSFDSSEAAELAEEIRIALQGYRGSFGDGTCEGSHLDTDRYTAEPMNDGSGRVAFRKSSEYRLKLLEEIP
jgi:hypothetical protein